MRTRAQNLEELSSAVRDLGLHTSLQGHRLACAVEGGKWGIGGASLWVAIWGSRWFIATWVPCIYIFPADADIAEVARVVNEVLSQASQTPYDLPEGVRLSHSLDEVTLDEFTSYAAQDKAR